MGREEELAAFRAKLAQDSADDFVRGPDPSKTPPPAVTEPSKFREALGRVTTSGERLLANPATQTLFASAGPSQGALTAATGYAINRSGIGQRNPTSFLREEEGGPQHLELKPIASPDVAVQPSPTLAQLNPALSRLGAPGGGGGAGGGMGSLQRDYKQAQQNQFGGLNDTRDLLEQRGDLQGERIEKTSQMQELNAAMKVRHTELRAEEDAKVGEQHQAFLQRNQQLADQIGAEKIDPDRIMGDKSLGQKLGMVIAGALSGIGGQGPAFMQRVDNMVEMGVKAQMANADNKKHQLAARQSVFQQMMAESGDRRTAEAQTKALMYQAIDQDMKAKADRLGIPEVQNNASLLSNEIVTQRLNPLSVQMSGDALKAAQAAAAAQASARHQAEKEAWERGIEVAKLGQEADKIAIERGKADTARKAPTDVEKTQQELDGNLKALQSFNPATVASGGSLGESASHLPAWVPGVTGARKDVNAREEYNALVRPGVGAAWKMRTGGVEPKNPTILEEQAKAFTVLPSDNEEVVADRMARFRQHMIQSAGAQGAQGPALPNTVKFREALDRK